MRRKELLRVAGATLVLGSAAGVVYAAVQITQNRYLQAGMVRLAVMTLEECLYTSLFIVGMSVGTVALIRLLFSRVVKPAVARVVEVRLRNPHAPAGVAAGVLFFLLGKRLISRAVDLSGMHAVLLVEACLIVMACAAGVLVARTGQKRLFPLLDYRRFLPLSAGWPAVLLFLLLLRSGIAIDGVWHPSKRPHIIFIVVDAMRPDHLGCFGYAKNTSPNIDRLAAEGTRFKTCVTVYPRTTPSAVSLLTGLYAHTHGTRALYARRGRCVALSLTLLPELLKNAGYRTAAFLDQPLLAGGTGIAQGFSQFRCLNSGKAGQRALRHQLDKSGDGDVTEGALQWLRRNYRREKPLFLFLWYLAPHWQYAPPQEDLEAFCDTGRFSLYKLLARDQDPNLTSFTKLYDGAELEFLIGAYDAEIHFVDRLIGVLIDHLKVMRLYDNSLIIVTSDHGENFGEHGVYFEHGEYCYDVDVRVPLIVKRPGQRSGETVGHQARTIDIVPTVAAAAGMSVPCEGVDLFSPDSGTKKSPFPLVAFAESDHSMYIANRRRYLPGDAGKWRMVREERWKLLYIPHPDQALYELYDLSVDPGETRNLVDDPAYKEEGVRLKEELFGWMKADDRERIEEAYQDEQGRALTERLKSLGYL